jgi:uncharacterized protein (TIGR02453 family)
MATFPGYPAKGITWLRQIRTHNERDWFLAHKDVFETAVKAPTEALVVALNQRLEKFAPVYVADPKKALTRIYRDVRFSKDKSPYNTYLGARFSHQGRPKEACAGFWLQISARGLELIGGSYLAGAPQLARLRERLATEHAAFERLCKRKALRTAMGELQGEQLKRVPRGFPPEHPAADLLRHKQLYFLAQLPVSVARSPTVVSEVARRFKLMTPFVTWLDETLAS